ncbi:MAG: SAM-dependent methyltransferase [Myxococcales bacterium]
MRRNQASATAAWVAAARGVGRLLPERLQLAEDRFGAELADGVVGAFARFCLRHPELGRSVVSAGGPLTAFLLWMQLRTRALDDILQRFAAEGGRQVVLLGAGYDCRALRFADALAQARVFEVDHPATQAKKKLFSSSERSAPVSYVDWDFEHRGTHGLPAELARKGLDLSARTLTIWEGVTMYLQAESVDETVRAVADYSGPDSWLAVTYLDHKAIRAPEGDARLTATLVSRVGEPYRFGFRPERLPAWLGERNFQLLADETDAALATRYVDARQARRFPRRERHVALARRG